MSVAHLAGKRLHRHLRRFTLVLVALVLLLPMSSCRPYHMYEGDRLSRAEISAIRQSRSVLLLEIDGGDTGLSNQFRLLPGKHTFLVQIYRLEQIPSAYADRRAKEAREPVCTCQLQLDTWAGSTYLFDAKGLPEDVWIAWAQRIQEEGAPQPDPESLPHCACSA